MKQQQQNQRRYLNMLWSSHAINIFKTFTSGHFTAWNYFKKILPVINLWVTSASPKSTCTETHGDLDIYWFIVWCFIKFGQGLPWIILADAVQSKWTCDLYIFFPVCVLHWRLSIFLPDADLITTIHCLCHLHLKSALLSELHICHKDPEG